jgi:hypothetical protein
MQVQNAEGAVMTAKPTLRQVYFLRHALGVHELNRSKWGYRNQFVCAQGTSNFDDWKGLVEQGLATQHNCVDTVAGPMILFRATVSGAKAAGLHPAAIKRAFAKGQ